MQVKIVKPICLQNLGVQKQGMKVQKAKRRGTAPSEPRSGKGKKVVALGKSSDRRGGPSGLSRKDSGRVKDGKAKRTVDLPRLSDLRITISNEKARLCFPIRSQANSIDIPS